MTSYEIGVIAVLGLVGYWGTTVLIRFFKKESEWTANQESRKNDYQKTNNQRESRQESASNKSWYEVLDVSPSASLPDIKAAYKRKISMYHPDKVSSMGPEFNEIAQNKSKEINIAYDEAIRLKA